MLSVIISMTLCAVSAYAFGIGGYGSFAGGETYYGKLTMGGKSEPGSFLIWTPNMSPGGGLVIDSNCAGNGLFNYRLHFGVDVLLADRKQVEKMYRVGMANTFGFGVVRTGLVRLWMGPQLGFFYLSGTNRYPVDSMLLWKYEKLEQSMIGMGFGAAIGINFNPGELVTISIEGGARYIIYYGNQSFDMIIRNVNDFTSGGYIPYTYNSWASSSGYEGYGCLSVLFRVKDTFGDTLESRQGKGK